MAVVVAYESGRGATVTDVSEGHHPLLTETLDRLGDHRLLTASSDLISSLGEDVRIIEVKGRGSSGPIKVVEREWNTFRAAGRTSWLYVVWNATQPHPYRLVVVRDPQRLNWVKIREGTPGSSQVMHESVYECQSDDVEQLGVEINLDGLALPPK